MNRTIAALAAVSLFACQFAAAQGHLVYVGSVASGQHHVWEHNPGGSADLEADNPDAQFTGMLRYRPVGSRRPVDFSFQCSMDERRQLSLPVLVDREASHDKAPMAIFHMDGDFEASDLDMWGVSCDPAETWCAPYTSPRGALRVSEEFSGSLEVVGRSNIQSALEWITGGGDDVPAGRTLTVTFAYDQPVGGSKFNRVYEFSTARGAGASARALSSFGRRARTCANKLRTLPSVSEFMGG